MELNDFISKFAFLFDETDENEFKAETVFKGLDEPHCRLLPWLMKSMM